MLPSDHQYERSYPVYNGTANHNFHNANATVYIVNGAAGDIEGIDPTFLPENPGYRAFAQPTVHTGYGRMTVRRAVRGRQCGPRLTTHSIFLPLFCFLVASFVPQVNHTALTWDYVDADTMKVVDTMTLTKTKQR